LSDVAWAASHPTPSWGKEERDRRSNDADRELPAAKTQADGRHRPYHRCGGYALDQIPVRDIIEAVADGLFWTRMNKTAGRWKVPSTGRCYAAMFLKEP
jgi:hypothetical protein